MLDGREVWHKPCLTAARKRGYDAKRITQGQHATGGYGFIRPHADPNMLDCHKVDYQLMRRNCVMIQDPQQIELYEDKSAQFWRWGQWMPQTWRFGSLTEALAAVESLPMPIVSKADVGASSVNVRIFFNLKTLRDHITEIFTKGIRVDHCSGGYMSTQRDYVLLQEFIPHTSTYRVNRIGNSYAVFLRHCYKDKPVAETGNTTPVTEMADDIRRALEKAQEITTYIGSKWVALDLLWCPKTAAFLLLETSCAWPTGSFNEAKFWNGDGTPTGKTWGDIWNVLFDEIEGGSWG